MLLRRTTFPKVLFSRCWKFQLIFYDEQPSIPSPLEIAARVVMTDNLPFCHCWKFQLMLLWGTTFQRILFSHCWKLQLVLFWRTTLHSVTDGNSSSCCYSGQPSIPSLLEIAAHVVMRDSLPFRHCWKLQLVLFWRTTLHSVTARNSSSCCYEGQPSTPSLLEIPVHVVMRDNLPKDPVQSLLEIATHVLRRANFHTVTAGNSNSCCYEGQGAWRPIDRFCTRRDDPQHTSVLSTPAFTGWNIHALTWLCLVVELLQLARREWVSWKRAAAIIRCIWVMGVWWGGGSGLGVLPFHWSMWFFI